MKKLLGLIVAVSMILTVFVAQAKVSFFEKDGKTYAKITYKNSSLGACNIIGTLTDNWAVPGKPMTLNADGEFEYIHEFTKAKEFYKFYDPAKSGEAAYMEDPDAEESVANPFGSKNAVLRKPKAGGAADAADAVAEVEYPKFNFGMWSRTYYWVKIGTNLSRKIVYDKNGNYKTTRDAVEVTSLTHEWQGEFNTEEDDLTRIWLSDTKLRSSNTAKIHGKALKYLQVDIELNMNLSVTADYNAYWTTSTVGSKKDRIAARYNYLNDTHKNAASDYIGILFGPLDKNGEWGRWVGTKTGDWGTNDCALWVDQIVISFPLPDVEVKVGVTGNNAGKSKDPMTLISGKRYGDKEDIGTNLEFLIHPTKVKNLNVNLAFAHTWRDETGEDATDFRCSVDNNDRKWIALLDVNYAISIAEFGVMGYMNSYAPQVIDSFNNADYVTSAWLRLKPIEGLSIEAQYANQLPTSAFDKTAENDDNNWIKFRTNEETYDVLANSAAWFKAGYLMKGFFDISYTLAMGGTMFKGNLAGEDSRFAGWDDADSRVNGVENYGTMKPYYYEHRGAQISNRLNFNINPLKNDLLKISYMHDLVLGKLDGTMKNSDGDVMEYGYMDDPDTEWDDTKGYQPNKFQLDNVFNPKVAVKYNKISADVMAQFSLTMYRDDTLAIDGDQKTKEMTTYFTFNKAKLNVGVDGISDILKGINIEYLFEMDYYEPFYGSTSKEVWAIMKNTIQYKNFYNEIIATMKFAKDISLGLGGIVRAYRGDQSTAAINKYTNELIDKLSNDDMADIGFAGSKKDFKQQYNSKILYYLNGGFALQFKYIIPIEAIMKPTFFCNVGLCWDPFNDDGDTTMSFKDDEWDTNVDYNSETSIIALGIQWDF